jgi:hypothetical protein
VVSVRVARILEPRRNLVQRVVAKPPDDHAGGFVLLGRIGYLGGS